MRRRSQACRPMWCWMRPRLPDATADGRLFRAEQLRKPRVPARARAWTPGCSSSTGPARWSDAQIVEEHAFAIELASCRAAGRRPDFTSGHDAFHVTRASGSPCFPGCAGRPPELDAPGARAKCLGAPSRACTASAALRPFATRARLTVERLGADARNTVLRCAASSRADARVIRACERRAARARAVAYSTLRGCPVSCAFMAIATSAICCGTSMARSSWTWTTA